MSLVVNVRPLIEALERSAQEIDVATGLAAAQGAHVYERFIKQELNKGSHPKGTPTGSQPGEPPWKITGTLQRSVQVGTPKRLGPGRWEADAGPTVIYGRAQELGHPRWPAGRTHPYLKPGSDKAEASGQVEAVIIRTWRRALAL